MKYRILIILAAILPAGLLHAQVPSLVSYQGRVTVNGGNFDGAGQFKFALVNTTGSVTLWSNDGTSVSGSQPTSAVTLTVTAGLYSVLLGDTALGNMTAVPVVAFSNPDVRLRVWFNDGPNGFQLLTPDQRLAPSGYLPDGSVFAAALASGAVTSTKIANGAVGSTQIAAGAVQNANIAAGAVQSANIAAGAVANNQLANSALTVTAGTGLAGGGTVALGGSVTLTNAGVRSLAGGGGVSVNASTGAITLGSNATSFNDVGTIVLRDELGGFSAGSINLFGALNLPSTSNANYGLIAQNGVSLLHTFGNANFFAGLGAGNFTTSGIHNTASGTLALSADTTGSFNTANGRAALFSNTTGSINTAIGLQVLYSNTTGSVNTASGVNAMFFNTTASRNVAVGNNALNTQSFDNGGAAWNSDNVAIGVDALLSNQPTSTSNGFENTAVGTEALRSNTTGFLNTATGWRSLYSNTTGNWNTASGVEALYNNDSGSENTATGYQALRANTTGSSNSAYGIGALSFNVAGAGNTASGASALRSNITGNSNTATGVDALRASNRASNNTASGYRALYFNTTASQNVAMGHSALYSQGFDNGGTAWNSDNVAVGFEALYSNQPTSIFQGGSNTALGTRALRGNMVGSNNTGIGWAALTNNTTGVSNTALGANANVGSGNLSNATAIGYSAQVNASNTIVLGDTNIQFLRCNAALSNLSDRTKKENFLPVDGAEVLRKIRGFELTSWNFIGQDKATMRHYGPMAQDFHAAFGRDAIGTSGEDTTINSGDLAGILMIAAQQLSRENVALRDGNAAMERRLAELESKDQEREARLAKLEQFIAAAPNDAAAKVALARGH